jgi:hypothetical protein
MKKLLLMLVAVVFASVTFAQTKTEVKPKDLPKSVTDYITQSMPAYKADKAFKVDSKGVITYNVLVVKGTEKHVLVFDKDGKFVKKGDNEAKQAKQKMENTKPAPQPAQTAPADDKATQPAKK